jgi:predicted HTH domain antitoxin
MGMLKVQDFVEARLYDSEDEVIQDALRHLLRIRPDLRIQLAVYRYQTEGLSLAIAASMAGVSWAQMKDILMEHGIQVRTVEEAAEEAQVLREYFQGSS